MDRSFASDGRGPRPAQVARSHAPAAELDAPAGAAFARTAGTPGAAGAAAGEPGPSLNVHMLDGFQVWLDGDPLAAPPAGKTQALLKLLLLRRRRPLSRARLCATLWPEADADCARNNLNVTLHRLRRALGRASLIRHGAQGYQLVHAGPVWLDTEQFLLHAEMGRLEETAGRTANAITQYEAALSIYRSDLVDESGGDEPLATEAQALRGTLNEVLERLAQLREHARDWHGCLQTTLRHLALDSCNELAHRRAMRCCAQLGQPQLAERQYLRCVHALREQLALPPSDETVALYRRIATRSAN
jgi:DNA-binding SARP family transcriptional activator